MLVHRAIRVLCALGTLGVGGFAACATDQFGTDPDAATTDGGTLLEAASPLGEAGGLDACTGDCQGGTCVAGICQPVVLASGLSGPYGIAVRGPSIYVAEYVPHGRVLRFDKKNTNQVPFVIANEATMAAAIGLPSYVSKPFSVGASTKDVAWTDLGAQAATGFAKLFYASIGDGGVPLASDAGPVPFYQLCGEGEVAVDDLYFFWANQATTQCLRPEQNGLFRGDPLSGHNGSIYFPVDAVANDAGGIVTDGGPSVTPLAVRLSANRVFVGAGNQLFIYDADKINDPSGVTASGALLGGTTPLPAPPYAIGSNFDTVVWTDFQPSGSVYALPKNAGPNTAPTIVATAQGGPLGVSLDDAENYVYYTSYADGKLMRVKKDGTGAPIVVLSGLDHPAFLASDTSALYFTTFGVGASDGTLMRVAKPPNFP